MENNVSRQICLLAKRWSDERKWLVIAPTKDTTVIEDCLHEVSLCGLMTMAVGGCTDREIVMITSSKEVAKQLAESLVKAIIDNKQFGI